MKIKVKVNNIKIIYKLEKSNKVIQLSILNYANNKNLET